MLNQFALLVDAIIFSFPLSLFFDWSKKNKNIHEFIKIISKYKYKEMGKWKYESRNTFVKNNIYYFF